MTDQSWTQVDALFATALEVAPDSRRAFLLEQSGGDVALTERVLQLLESLDTAERVIGESADALVSAPELDDLGEDTVASGTRLGSYEVLEEIGRGGMGAVYRAVRADAAFERQVAIKVMKRAVASELMLRRFGAERRMLATLEHPNIARLYDSGLTADGRPYLVMEYVEGDRIDRYVANRQLDLRARLDLFDAVCDAVAFAHRHLIVHRDLKPANVLVTPPRGGNSETARAVLLDFGIAKLVADDNREVTRAGSRFLTPEYAAPEQFRDSATTATMDVYSLGVLLHELLVGERPEWQRLVADGASLDALEHAMAAPSVAVGRRSATSAQAPVAARALRGDLDTIVLTALAPSPERRYGSVEALRDDIRRFRSGFPIRARTASLADRARKFVRRNRALTSVAGLAVILAAGYLGTLVVQSRRIAAERDRAERQRARADQVSSLLVGMFDSPDPFEKGRPDTLRVSDFLEQGAANLESQLRGQSVVRGTVLTAVARAQRQLGRLDRARALLVQAERLLRDSSRTSPLPLAEALDELGQLEADDNKFEDGERVLRDAVSLFSRSRDARPTKVAMTHVHLSTVLSQRGRHDSAAAHLDRAERIHAQSAPTDSVLQAALLVARAALQYRTGQADSAVATQRRTVEFNTARLGADHPLVHLGTANLAFALTTIGRNPEAIPLYRSAIEGLRARLTLAHPLVLQHLRGLSAALSREGKAAAAESTMRVAVTAARQSGESSTALAETLDSFGQLMERWDKPEQASTAYAEALAINRRVYGEAHPITAIGRARVANLRCKGPGPAVADPLAIADFRAAMKTIDREFSPAEPVRLKVHADYGLCLAALGRHEEARRELQANFDAGVAGRGSQHPMVQQVGRALAGFYESIGDSGSADRVRGTLRGSSR
jgi:serine/threonine-protein kinase